MKTLVVAGALVLDLCLLAGSSAFADYRDGILLTRSEARAYHACLYEAWIQDWCHANSARPTSSYERVYAGCVLANRGGRFPLEGRSFANTDDYCWTAAHRIR
jgi:hypothetical protein